MVPPAIGLVFYFRRKPGLWSFRVGKKLVIYGGVGFKGDSKGIKMKKTVCGHKVHDKISQINLKVTKQGNQKLDEVFPSKPKEEKKE